MSRTRPTRPTRPAAVAAVRFEGLEDRRLYSASADTSDLAPPPPPQEPVVVEMSIGKVLSSGVNAFLRLNPVTTTTSK